MAAYLHIEILRVRDRNAYERYVAAARPIVESHGGVYMLVSNQVTAFSDAAPPQRVILIRFADRRALDRCFRSPEYLAIAPLRETSTDSRALVIEDGPPINC